LILSTEASQFAASTSYSQLEEMFYFKSKRLFDATVTILPKEALVSSCPWFSQTSIFQASIEFAEGLEFEDIITYSLIDLKSGRELKVFCSLISAL
jgi:hypothetical protein